jgi:adenine-specific DNA-methyltransferase
LEKSCTTGYTVEVILRSDLIAKRSELLLTDCFPKKWLESLTIDTKKFQIAYLGTKKYFFSLKNHFQNNQQPLRRFVTIGDLFEIGNGMVSGLDKAFWIDNQLDSNQTITKLNAIERSLLRRVIKARFMQQYTVSKYTNYIFIEENQFESEKDFQRQCPTLYSILQPYKEDLLSRWVPKPTSWYIWSFPRNYEIFLSFKNKFYLPCKERFDNKGFIRCVLDQTNALGVQDITVLGLHTWVKESPEYLLAYLNSDILFKWLLQKGLKRGGVFQFSEHPLVTIPVRLINWESENEIAIHEKISKLVLLLLKSSSDSEKKEWKKKIDDLLQRLIFE